MARVYKLTFYAVDPNEYYDNALHLYNHLSIRESKSGLFFRAGRDELLTSKEFDWSPSLPLNKICASKEDFEKYFQKRT